MKHTAVAALACIALTACTLGLDRRDTESSTPVAGSSPPTHEQQCSALRADIASAEHNQRTIPPGSNAPIIAAASEAKEDRRIQALKDRYAQLGCAGIPVPASGSPTH